MIQCKQCKWWHAPHAQVDPSRLVLPTGEVVFPPHGICRCIVRINDEPSYASVEELPLAYTRDAEEYCADLFTHPDFGCTLGDP